MRVALPASLSARSFHFTPACPGQYTHRSFNSTRKKKERTWSLSIRPMLDLFQEQHSGNLRAWCSMFNQISKYIFVVVLNLVLLFAVVVFFFVVVFCSMCLLVPCLLVGCVRLSFSIFYLHSFVFLCFSSSSFFRLRVCAC